MRRIALAGVVGASTLSLPALAHAAGRIEPIASRPLVLLFAMAALSLVPFALLMTTCFVRIAVVLSILRSAIGSAQVPPGQVLTGLALILTLFVMAPTGERIYRAVEPVLGVGAGAELLSGESVHALALAGERAKEPLREFLIKHADRRDRALFHGLALKMRSPAERAAIADGDLLVVVPAFVTSELRRAFEIGFLLFIPFLVVDLVVANLLLALGMHMLAPATIALPFKLLLFVLADGWHLVIRGLIEGYL
ncbi:MAG TPA: type III secretion system export apparatus subunit SctR [Polyangia bacterium]|nr:type III secretion system export apparatus subunit SctR [Polyangia bacterium]